MIQTLPLMARVQEDLAGLLGGLSPEQWGAATACRGWTVRDVVAHLLDGHLRRLSLCRDGHSVPFEGASIGEFLNLLNASWVQAARRLSPRVLIGLHEWAGPQVLGYWRSLDPLSPAHFAVAWAGEEVSAVWFDCARDFTEQWHHQQQIREAAGAASLLTREYFPVVLSIFLRCVPVAYRDCAAPEGTAVRVTAVGEAGGEWSLTHHEGGWRLDATPRAIVQAGIAMDARDLWQLFTKKLTPGEAAARAVITGAAELAAPFFHGRALMG